MHGYSSSSESDDEYSYRKHKAAVPATTNPNDQNKKKKKRRIPPQQTINKVWKRFSNKRFNKALAVLPFDPVLPPTISERSNELLSAGYERAAEECRRKVRKIIQECRRVNMRYRDPGWDLDWDLKMEKGHCLNSLGRTKFDLSMSNLPNAVVPKAVKRVHEIFEKPKFLENISGSDVKQGSLGDCWLMASFSGLANVKDGIQRICVEYDTRIGIYGFVFYRDGEWIYSIIDDKLYLKSPCWDSPSLQRDLLQQIDREDVERVYRTTYQTGSKALFFAQCKDQNETWVPLIEKAYAKAHGDYASLSGGWIGEGLEDLSGGVTTELLASDILDLDGFWENELSRVNEEFLFGCSTGLLDGGYGDRDGISEGHAYVVMEARTLKNGTRLLKLRNPWGKTKKGIWEGAWSDGSKEWTTEVQEELGHQFGNDSVFWISYEDLLRKYQHFDRTRLFRDPDWRCCQRWIGVEVPWKPQYNEKFHIKLTRESPIVLVLSQLDNRYFKGLHGQYNFRLQFRLHELDRPDPEDYIVRSHGNYLMDRSVSIELPAMLPGSYSVFISVVGERDTDLASIEEVVKRECKKRVENEKLVQVGYAYDLAHSKAAAHLEAVKKLRKKADQKKASEARVKERHHLWEKRHLNREVTKMQGRKNNKKLEARQLAREEKKRKEQELRPKDQAVQTEDSPASKDQKVGAQDEGTTSSADAEVAKEKALAEARAVAEVKARAELKALEDAKALADRKSLEKTKALEEVKARAKAKALAELKALEEAKTLDEIKALQARAVEEAKAMAEAAAIAERMAAEEAEAFAKLKALERAQEESRAQVLADLKAAEDAKTAEEIRAIQVKALEEAKALEKAKQEAKAQALAALKAVEEAKTPEEIRAIQAKAIEEAKALEIKAAEKAKSTPEVKVTEEEKTVEESKTPAETKTAEAPAPVEGGDADSKPHDSALKVEARPTTPVQSHEVDDVDTPDGTPIPTPTESPIEEKTEEEIAEKPESSNDQPDAPQAAVPEEKGADIKEEREKEQTEKQKIEEKAEKAEEKKDEQAVEKKDENTEESKEKAAEETEKQEGKTDEAASASASTSSSSPDLTPKSDASTTPATDGQGKEKVPVPPVDTSQVSGAPPAGETASAVTASAPTPVAPVAASAPEAAAPDANAAAAAPPAAEAPPAAANPPPPPPPKPKKPTANMYVTSDGESSASPIEDWELLYSSDDMTRKPRINGQAQLPVSKYRDETEDENEPDPWNAICVVGLRVYSRDENLELRVVMEGGELEEGGMGEKGGVDLDNAQANAGGARSSREKKNDGDDVPYEGDSEVEKSKERRKKKKDGDKKSDDEAEKQEEGFAAYPVIVQKGKGEEEYETAAESPES